MVGAELENPYGTNNRHNFAQMLIDIVSTWPAVIVIWAKISYDKNKRSENFKSKMMFRYTKGLQYTFTPEIFLDDEQIQMSSWI